MLELFKKHTFRHQVVCERKFTIETQGCKGGVINGEMSNR